MGRLKIGLGIAITLLVILATFFFIGMYGGEVSEKPKPHYFGDVTRSFNIELQRREVSEHLRNEGGEGEVTVQVLLICVEGLILRHIDSFKKIFYMEANETVIVAIRMEEEELTSMCDEGEDLNVDFRAWATKSGDQEKLDKEWRIGITRD